MVLSVAPQLGWWCRFVGYWFELDILVEIDHDFQLKHKEYVLNLYQIVVASVGHGFLLKCAEC